MDTQLDFFHKADWSCQNHLRAQSLEFSYRVEKVGSSLVSDRPVAIIQGRGNDQTSKNKMLGVIEFWNTDAPYSAYISYLKIREERGGGG